VSLRRGECRAGGCQDELADIPHLLAEPVLGSAQGSLCYLCAVDPVRRTGTHVCGVRAMIYRSPRRPRAPFNGRGPPMSYLGLAGL
jgi:hypothetical protein